MALRLLPWLVLGMLSLAEAVATMTQRGGMGGAQTSTVSQVARGLACAARRSRSASAACALLCRRCRAASGVERARRPFGRCAWRCSSGTA